MKIGFSTLGCPDWDLNTVIDQAKAMGYEAVELRGLQGEMHLPASPVLAQNPAGVASRFAEAGLDIACLGSSASFHWQDRRKLAEQKAQTREFIELAGALGCPHVRVFPDEVPRYEVRQRTLVRIADALRELAPYASAHGTTLVLENHGDFAGSRDLWFLLDSVGHPGLQCCWNPCHAKAAGERPTLSVPRLGRRIAMTHLVDGRFNDQGLLEGYALPGEGAVDLEHYLTLLTGTAFDGYLIFEWPKLWLPALAAPEQALPAALASIRGMLSRLSGAKDLSAYKGDKNAPTFRAPRGPAVSAAR